MSFDGSALSLPFIVGHFTDDDDNDEIANYLDPDANNSFELSGLELGPESFPSGGIGNHVVQRAWAFAPFETGLESGGFSVTINLSEAPAAGTAMSLLWADYELGVAHEQFESTPATLSNDGLSVSGEVNKLSLLLLVETPL